MEFKTVCVVGLGYIGLPTAILLAKNGLDVKGVDVSPHVVESVNAGRLHIVEPGLESLLQEVCARKSLRAISAPEAADAFILAVPTPFVAAHKPDLSYIKAAADAIAPVLQKGNLVILESTSPVGTTEQLAAWLAGARPDLTFPQTAGEDADIQVAHCPERVLPGSVLQELGGNDRIIGGISETAGKLAGQLYRTFVTGAIKLTNARTAEMCKLTENSFRDVNIAFANELSLLCADFQIDVWELIRLANLHPRVDILQPGCGVGGHCIAVDPWFLVDSAPERARLIRTAREINDGKPLFVLGQVKAALADVLAQNPGKTMSDATVACLGLAFKPNIDDLRESPALALTAQIAALGCKVLAVEPHIQQLPPVLHKDNVALASLDDACTRADVVCVLVRHAQFVDRVALILKSRCLIDPVGLTAA